MLSRGMVYSHVLKKHWLLCWEDKKSIRLEGRGLVRRLWQYTQVREDGGSDQSGSREVMRRVKIIGIF